MSGISFLLAAFDPQDNTHIPVQIKDMDNHVFKKVSSNQKPIEKVTFLIDLLLF